MNFIKKIIESKIGSSDLPAPVTSLPHIPESDEAQDTTAAPIPEPVQTAPVQNMFAGVFDTPPPEKTDHLPSAVSTSPPPKQNPLQDIAQIEGYLDRINASVTQWDEAPPPNPKPSAQTAIPDANEPTPTPTPPAAVLPIGRANRRANRAKTRLLGFETMTDVQQDPMSGIKGAQRQPQEALFPVGWVVIEDGPGRGQAFTLQNGVSQIGRGEDQAIRLDMGDTSISRSNHAALAYDDSRNKFYLGHGGKANLVRLNGVPVLSTEEVQNHSIIEIGETKLRFVALCSADFNWDTQATQT